jgi:hypothetical protein
LFARQNSTESCTVSAEALTSLHDLIKQDTQTLDKTNIHTLDKTNIERLQRHIETFADAAHECFAERTLFRKQNRFLTSINDEAKVRRSTKSVKVGEAKVMSYEDIEEARRKRVANDAIKGRGKCDRKKKGAAVEIGRPESEPEPEMASAVKEVMGYKRKGARKWKNNSQEDKPKVAPVIEVSEPWRAPVARMI